MHRKYARPQCSYSILSLKRATCIAKTLREVEPIHCESGNGGDHEDELIADISDSDASVVVSPVYEQASVTTVAVFDMHDFKSSQVANSQNTSGSDKWREITAVYMQG